MADIPLKNPSKKFTEGDELECRVLSVDIKDNKVILTNKKSLVNTKLPTIHDNSQIHKHLEIDGFIAMINNRGVLVAFYNNIKGWVPLSELSEEKIEQPEKVFYLGQVVRCRVKNYDEETNKIVLSFRKGPRQKDRKLKERDTSVPDDFEAGKIVECKIKSKRQELMIVSDTSTGKDAILYKAHLADFDDLCDVLWESLQEGDILERVVHFRCTNKIIVSMKPSLLKQTENDIIPTDFTEISKDMILPAVVKNIVEYGIFFTLTGGLGGLIPMKVASDNYLPYEEITNYIHVGQSIVVRVTYLDTDKRTFVGSMLTRHCFPRSSDKAAILMKLYLENKEMVTKVLSAGQSMGGLLSKMKQIPVGSVVTAVVTDITTDGISCNMSNGLSAFINHHMLYDIKPVVGDKVLGVVLSIDMIKQRIDLSLDQSIVAAMKNSETEDQIQQLNVDENIPAEVLQVNSNYYMVSLRGKALGSMAYVPTKHTINCINELDLYPVKQNIHVKIHSVYNENLIALTHLHQIKSSTPSKSKDKKNKLYLSIGGVYKAKVKQIHPTIMYLDIEGKPGRVHCTNMVDTIQDGHHPFSDYQVGKEIMVRITGHSKMPKKEEKVAECTARPSQLKGRLEKSSRSFPLKSNRRVFIDKIDKENVLVDITSQRTGITSIFDLSDDLMILENLKSHFKKGQGYNGEVIGCRGRSKIVFTFTGRREKASEGETTKCYITDIDSESKELKLSLPARHTAVVKLSTDIKKYHKGQWLWCQVTSVDDTEKKCSVTLKKSRGWKTDK
ncbi:protein RRP5 homolog [Patella vulgata]|uniref:protein RRP5 homolog n=1 Tax=Patella vulgata TaxID=6465 RepID=UPI0021804577|nr:protein RRP5 homolog [Patella vulgata]